MNINTLLSFSQRILGILIVGFLSFFSIPGLKAQAPYCTPQFSMVPCTQPGVNDLINNFYTTGATVNISNLNSGCSMLPNNYSYMQCPISLVTTQGATFTVNAQCGATYAQGFRIWIDYNQNNSFLDPGEDVWNSGGSGFGVFSGNVTVPMTALSGTTRMRVRCSYSGVPTSPCNQQTYGEVEDYDVVIGTVPGGGTVGPVTGDSAVCSGLVYTYSTTVATGATSYNWTVPAGSVINSGQGTTSISVTIGSTPGDICVLPNIACVTPSCLTFTVSPVPVAPSPVTGPTDVCDGSTHNYSITPVTGITNYTWTVPPGAFITSGQGTAAITVVFGSTSGNICVEGSNTCGVSPPTCTAVNVFLIPAQPSAGPDQAFCGATATLAGSPASVGTGTWTVASGPGTIAFSNANSPTSLATPSNSGIYLLYWTILNGVCSEKDSVIISFDIPPSPANAGPDQIVCGQTTTLVGNTATTGTGQWVQISGPGYLTYSASNNPGSSATVSGTPWSFGVYTMRWTIINGSCSSSDTVQITFDQPVNPADGGQDFVICGDNVPVLGAIDPAIGTGEWAQVFGLGTANFSDTLFHNSSVSVATYGQYILSWTVTNGSCSSSDTVSLVFKEPATVSEAGPDQETCGLTTTMAGNVAVVGQGLWTKVSGPGALSFVNVTGENSIVTASQYGSYIIRWTISNFDCISEDSLKVTFYEEPSEAKAGNDTLVCNLKEMELNAVSTVVGAGKWSVHTGPAILFDSTLNTTLVIDLQTGLNEFIWTNSNGVCPVSQDTISITVSKAEAEFESSRYVFFVDDVIQLTDLSSINPVEWSWTFDDGDSSFIQHPKHSYQDTGSYVITLMMENEDGCLDTMERIVTVKKHLNIYVPNSFTPNNDGRNDEFKVYGDGISEIELLIFNRWGELIFETRDIDTGWNGRKNNGGGKPLPGVYIYKLKVVDYHGVEKKQDGTITIMK